MNFIISFAVQEDVRGMQARDQATIILIFNLRFAFLTRDSIFNFSPDSLHGTVRVILVIGLRGLTQHCTRGEAPWPSITSRV